jgi:hypothetical protein
MRRSTVRQMRANRVDAAMVVRPYIVSVPKREFLLRAFDQQLPVHLFSLDLVGDEFGRDRFSKPTTTAQSRRREHVLNVRPCSRGIGQGGRSPRTDQSPQFG